MTYNPTKGHNIGCIHAILSSQESVSRAVSELNGAPLFNRNITICPFVRQGVRTNRKVERNSFELRWGWHASKPASISQIKQRPPLLEHPTNIFAPIREGRTVVFENIPAPAPGQITPESDLLFYELLHAFDVVSLGRSRWYKPTKKKSCCGAKGQPSAPLNRSYLNRHKSFPGHIRSATFETSEDAQLVCQLYDRHICRIARSWSAFQSRR
jgi:hypothetical protein